MNTNFSVFRGHLLPVDPSTATAAATNTYDLGSEDHRWKRVFGKVYPSVVSTTGSMTIAVTNDVVLMDASSATITATLPSVSANTGASFKIKNIGTGGFTVLIDGNGAETIDGTATVNIVDGQGVNIVTNGVAWYFI